MFTIFITPQDALNLLQFGERPRFLVQGENHIPLATVLGGCRAPTSKNMDDSKNTIQDADRGGEGERESLR